MDLEVQNIETDKSWEIMIVCQQLGILPLWDTMAGQRLNKTMMFIILANINTSSEIGQNTNVNHTCKHTNTG